MTRGRFDVSQLIAQAHDLAREDVLDILRERFRAELLAHALEELEPAQPVVALVGIADGVRPITRALDADATTDERNLEHEVRVHNDLLQEALAKGGVIPFRFGVTFADEQALSEWVADHHDELALELERLRGKAEWTVEFFSPKREGAADRYLERRLATAVRRDARELLVLLANEVSGDAYLVEDVKLDEFREALRALTDDGYELELSGPWPAYSFARLP